MEYDELLRIERICAAVDAAAGPPVDRTRNPPEAVLRTGYFGASYDAGRVRCRYDASLLDPAALKAAVRARLTAEDADLVDYVASTRPAPPLADLLDAVMAWHPAKGGGATMFARLDNQREVVLVDIADTAPAEAVAQLREMGGELIELIVFPHDGRSGRV